ncbi:T9SS type B sorting domain-containing protein [Nafulsella turpanensis]|uniref:T9SS type B sorting domain-containing protein n=1 Tax=Nafulsella turpanensis TaxID=1265690 RepID=UPI000362BEC1|nr:gliding motility-associated C-terminal domain-containing protein [Nafulsella turpanensis]
MKSIFTYIIFLILLCSTSWSYGQGVSSDNGFFTIDYIKGCIPLEVRVTYNTGRHPEDYVKQVKFGDSSGYSPITTTLSHTYYETGTFTVKMLASDEFGNPTYDSLEVEVKAPVSPYFEAYSCGNNKVKVEVIPNSDGYDYFELTTDEGGEPVILNASNNYEAELAYATSGSHSVIVEGFYSGEGVNMENCDSSYPQQVLVYDEVEAAQFSDVTVSSQDSSITLTYPLQRNVKYRLEYQINGTGPFETYPIQMEGAETVITDLNPAENFYCFRIKTDRSCTDEGLLYSEPICTARLQVEAADNGNQVSFTTASTANIERIIILRNGMAIDTLAPVTSGIFLDSLIDCGLPYQYAIRLDYTGGISSLTEGTPVSNEVQRQLAAPVNIASQWLGASTVQFSLPEIAGQKDIRLMVYTTDANQRLVNEADTSFISLPAAGENTCYRFSYIDACGNESALSEPVCALYLQSTSVSVEELLLGWNEYTGYSNGVQNYVLEVYPPDGGTPNPTPVGLSTQHEITQLVLNEPRSQFRIYATPLEAGLPASSSNLFDIPMRGYFPNAFTPNGDEQNDVFKAEGLFVKEVDLQIYNRWGALVFRTNDNELGWNGTRNGEELPTGTYIFKAVVTTIDGTRHTEQGAVFLIRK